MPSSPKSPMSSGKMSQDFRMPRMHSKKLSFCPLDSNKFSQEVENLGREFCFMVLQEQEKHILLKLVQLKLRELSSQCPLLISWASMLVRAKDWSKRSLTWLVKNSLRSSSLIRSTPCVVTDLMEKTKHQEELRLNFWSRCKVLVMMTEVCLFWELLTCHGLWILPSEDVSREEYIFLFLNMKPGTPLFI